MSTEDYVSFEIAKLLKEKGFDEICSYEWGIPDVDGGYVLQKWNITNGQIKNSDLIDGAYTAPTQSLALKWLREVHHIHIKINVESFDGINPIYEALYDEIINIKNDNFIDYGDSYEEAVETALLYVLKNLI